MKQFTFIFFPSLTALLVGLAIANQEFCFYLVMEDSIVEWCTFLVLFASSLLSFRVAQNLKKKQGAQYLFFYLFAAFNLLAAFEEISWGQRILNLESGSFFLRNSDQGEINLHNTFQGITGVLTRQIALLVLLIYGVVMPVVIKRGSPKWLLPLSRLVVFPPDYLAMGFIFASILMLDMPTGMEEEVGEFYYGVCFLLFLTDFWKQQKKVRPVVYKQPRVTILRQEEKV